MKTIQDEPDDAVRRRIAHELADGRDHETIVGDLEDEGVDPERARRLFEEQLDAVEEAPGKRRARDKPANWLALAGAGCLCLGVVATITTNHIEYPALIAGVLALVVGMRRTRQQAGASRRVPPASGSGARIAIVMSLAVAATIFGLHYLDQHPELFSSSPSTGTYIPQPTGPDTSDDTTTISGIYQKDCDGLTFSRHGLLATYGGTEVTVWKLEGKLKLASFDIGFKPDRVVFAGFNALMAMSSKGDVKRLEIGLDKIVDLGGSGPWKGEATATTPAVTPDGMELVTGGTSPALWSIKDKKLVRRYEGAGGMCEILAATKAHVAGRCGGPFLVWDIDKPKVLAEEQEAFVQGFTISPNDTYVVSWDWDTQPDASKYTYSVFQLQTMSKLYAISGYAKNDEGGAISFKPDAAFDAHAQLLVLRTGEKQVTGVQPQSGKTLWKRSVPEWGFDLDLSPDGSVLALSGDEPDLIELPGYQRPGAVAPSIKVTFEKPRRAMTARERDLVGTWTAKLGKGSSELPDFANGTLLSMKGQSKDLLGVLQATMDNKRIPSGCLWMELRDDFSGRREPCALNHGKPAALQLSNPLNGKKIDKSVPLSWYLDGDTLKIDLQTGLVAFRSGDAGTESMHLHYWYLKLKDDTFQESFPEYAYVVPQRHAYVIQKDDPDQR